MIVSARNNSALINLYKHLSYLEKSVSVFVYLTDRDTILQSNTQIRSNIPIFTTAGCLQKNYFKLFANKSCAYQVINNENGPLEVYVTVKNLSDELQVLAKMYSEDRNSLNVLLQAAFYEV
jgi:hypothetical protein